MTKRKRAVVIHVYVYRQSSFGLPMTVPFLDSSWKKAHVSLQASYKFAVWYAKNEEGENKAK